MASASAVRTCTEVSVLGAKRSETFYARYNDDIGAFDSEIGSYFSTFARAKFEEINIDIFCKSVMANHEFALIPGLNSCSSCAVIL